MRSYDDAVFAAHLLHVERAVMDKERGHKQQGPFHSQQHRCMTSPRVLQWDACPRMKKSARPRQQVLQPERPHVSFVS